MKCSCISIQTAITPLTKAHCHWFSLPVRKKERKMIGALAVLMGSLLKALCPSWCSYIYCLSSILCFRKFIICVATYSTVSECSDVPERHAEVSDRDRRCQCQSVRRAVCQPVHAHHDAAQTGTCTLILLLKSSGSGRF